MMAAWTGATLARRVTPLIHTAFLWRGRLATAPVFNLTARARRPGKILGTPISLRPGDPEFARRAYSGAFYLAAGHVDTGPISPFHIADAPSGWFAELAGFSWLKHMSAAGDGIARLQCRALIDDWLSLPPGLAATGWRPPIVARRLLSWLECAPFYLENAGGEFERRLLRNIDIDIRYLSIAASKLPTGLDRLNALTGLVTAGLCVTGHDHVLNKAIPLLEKELARQVLADGGHVSRSPAIILMLVQDLVCLCRTFAIRHMVVPEGIISVVDRMVPMLRFFQHGDRGLAFFNGCNSRSVEALETVFKEYALAGQPLDHAPHSGFHRINHDRCVLVMDTGAKPFHSPYGASHAGCLAFEMSDGPHRIVVNCGAEHDDDNPWHTPTSTTAAHSTLIIEDTSQSLQNNTSAWRRFWPARNHQTHTTSHRTRQDGGTLIEASHEGYLDLFGLRHSRRIYMSDTGGDLRGEDIVEFQAPGTAPKAPVQSAVCTRFHIHPDIKVTRAQKSNSVLLVLPNRSGWTFTARGARLELEDSVYLEAKRPPRRTQQIALYGSVTKQTRIKWAFTRLEKAPKRKAATKSNPLNLPWPD